jgi:lipopolysaccharide/colanic/teichoic acid biosynthesis glycosyltransferase
VPEYLRYYSPVDREVLTVRPGITDPASIHFRDEEELLGRFTDRERVYTEIILPLKLELARDYVSRQSFFSDLRLVCQTLTRLADAGAATRR